MIGFLLTTTIGVFQLVLRELQDNRVLWNYIRATAWAESGAELALLTIKQNGYGYYESYSLESGNTLNHILALDPQNPTAQDIEISYDINTKVTSYEWSIPPLGYDIIPLFYLTGATDSISVEKISDISLSSSDSSIDVLSWNILWDTGWVSWNGLFDSTTSITIKTLWSDNSIDVIENEDIGYFLSSISSGYLILFHPWWTQNITYTLSSSDPFSTPRANIISQGQVGKHRQNMQTDLDNTQYLNTLKHALYGR